MKTKIHLNINVFSFDSIQSSFLPNRMHKDLSTMSIHTNWIFKEWINFEIVGLYYVFTIYLFIESIDLLNLYQDLGHLMIFYICIHCVIIGLLFIYRYLCMTISIVFNYLSWFMRAWENVLFTKDMLWIEQSI